MLASWKKSYDNPKQCIQKQRYHFADKGLSSQSYSFSSSYMQIWELDHKEGWAPENECFWIVVLEKTFESPLDCKEIKLVNPKGNQPWIFIGRTDAEVEALILWPSDTHEEPTHCKRPWGWESLKAEEEESSWGQIDCIASSIQWTSIWANSGR